jgi:hypothetical protein
LRRAFYLKNVRRVHARRVGAEERRSVAGSRGMMMRAIDALLSQKFSAGRPYSLWWSKLEILFGLGSAGIGIAWAGEADLRSWLTPALCSLGGYLALAGHRSHLYDAMVRRTAASARFTSIGGP